MTNHTANPDRRTAVVVLTLVVVVLWLAAVGMGVTAFVLLHDVGAAAGRVAFIVGAWFATPALPAVAATVGLVVLRRSRRRTAV
jgi:hypothetical protein